MCEEGSIMWEKRRELIHCKDCEYFDPNRYYEDSDPEEEQGRCGVISYIMDGYYDGMEKRSFNDFCSRGELKRIST